MTARSPEASLPPEVLAAVQAVNEARRRGRLEDVLERQLDATFGSRHRLAVYGSLAPGRENQGQLAGLTGDWSSGLFVHGEMVPSGWGAGLGFPALRWRFPGPRVAVLLFVSPDLEWHWSRLDAFEGRDYVRILVPVFAPSGFATVANLYEAA